MVRLDKIEKCKEDAIWLLGKMKKTGKREEGYEPYFDLLGTKDAKYAGKAFVTVGKTKVCYEV
jgi:hypothetical protein